MNIFLLDSVPQLAAHYHCDKHVVKMVCETAQILCTALELRGDKEMIKLVTGYTKDIPWCKPTHEHHPCVKIVAESFPHYQWLTALGFFLDAEYTKRYKKEHAYKKLLVGFYKFNDEDPTITTTHFPSEMSWPQAMPEQYRIAGNPVQAYRNYYVGEKSRFAKWKYNKEPDWYTNAMKLKLWKELPDAV